MIWFYFRIKAVFILYNFSTTISLKLNSFFYIFELKLNYLFLHNSWYKNILNHPKTKKYFLFQIIFQPELMIFSGYSLKKWDALRNVITFNFPSQLNKKKCTKCGRWFMAIFAHPSFWCIKPLSVWFHLV